MATAQANTQFEAADDAITSEICVIAANGNKMNLHKAIRDSGLTRGFVEDSVTCNQLPIVEFVEQYGENVAKINRYITAGDYTGTLISRAN
jgi:predicted RNase H-like nuclease